MKRALLVALCIVPSASCGGEPEIEPATGAWNFSSSAPSKDTCGGYVSVSSGNFLLTNNGDGTFTVDPQDGSEVFDCTLDADAFDCPDRLQGTEMVSGFDATLEVKVSATGTFSSNTAASGRQDGTISCTGSQCSAITLASGVSFPCEVSASFTASLNG